ncbi:hypothetical protein ACHAXR_012262 [Thalassiosira sp. AJA248-18]
MRFLLKPSRSVAANTHIKASRAKAAASALASSVETGDGSGKAWGQQCSPKCGCVLRIEAQLSEHTLSTSPTIVQASYHAKRVMAKTTSHKTGNNNDTYMTPLTTQHSSQLSRPILTSCTCPTLHHLAQQTVDHLPGKTLAQMRNEIDMGLVGARSSVAFRHTVLRENVIPATASSNKLGYTRSKAVQQTEEDANVEKDSSSGVHEMNSTHRRGDCYDLVEDSLLSMIHERMPRPRKDDRIESYSPTLGGHFRMYSQSGRNQRTKIDDTQQDQSTADEENELPSFNEMGDWTPKSPSSFFLFGDDSHTTSTTTFQNMMESINNHIYGGGANNAATRTEDNVSEERYRPTTTYLQLLDMYGDEYGSEKMDEQAMDDWIEYVDQIHYSQGNRSTTG